MNNFNQEIFKAYDIRGVYQTDFDSSFARHLGRAFMSWLQKPRAKVFIAGDMRLSTPDIKQALITGLRESGAEIIDGGILSTPTFYFGVSESRADGGIMISASHNPAAWNGFKITGPKAAPISSTTGLEDLKEKIIKEDYATASSVGTLRECPDILAKAMAYDLRGVDLQKIKPFKIVADASNGMGAQYLEALFSLLPGELVKLNFALDGSFPVHEADPLKEENIKQLQEAVKGLGADFGIATDGDGDRIFLVDNEGQTVFPALLRGLLAKIFLRDKPGAIIGYDVRPGKITLDMILEAGGRPLPTRVGHSLIKEMMLKNDAYFAGESSGHFFLNDSQIGCFERPIIMLVKLLQEFSEWPGTLADNLRPYEKYFHSGEINSEVSDKTLVFQALEDKYSSGQIDRLDGLSVTYPDYWFNVRGSNTENKIRLNLEARTKELMIEKRGEVLSIIRQA